MRRRASAPPLLMRFFTLERVDAAGETSDSSQQMYADYAAHVERLAPFLPEPLLQLGRQPYTRDDVLYLGDGLLRRAFLDRTAKTLEIGLRIGEIALGYYDLDLVYQGVRIERTTCAALRAVAVLYGANADIVFSEVDRSDDGLFVHRFRFWIPLYRGHTVLDVEVVFDDMTWTRTPQPDRNWKSVRRYQETPRPPRRLHGALWTQYNSWSRYHDRRAASRKSQQP